MAAPATVTASDAYTVTPAPYPAHTKSSSTKIKTIETTATAVGFTDKIFITITQNGRLAHWVHVPLDISATDASMNYTAYLDRGDDELPSDLLPMHQLTATTILGGTVPELNILGQTFATQIASAIKTRNDMETRLVVVGMGLDKSMVGREEYTELIGLVLEVL